MVVEHCDECGFDGDDWSDEAAVNAIEALPVQWRNAVAGVNNADAQRRPIHQVWSIAEYADHVRETLYTMRVVLDIAVAHPGTDLGEPSEPAFAPAPQPIDVAAAVAAIDTEAHQLAARLRQLGPSAWESEITISAQLHDPRWICRHALHDASHHLLDVDRLKAALSNP